MSQINRNPNISALLKELPPFVAHKHPRFRELIGYSGNKDPSVKLLDYVAHLRRLRSQMLSMRAES